MSVLQDTEGLVGAINLASNEAKTPEKIAAILTAKHLATLQTIP